MTNFKQIELGSMAEIINQENGKVFLHDSLNLSSCEISVNALPQGCTLPFSHKHKQNEEIYIVMKGEGTMLLDNEEVKIKEGSCVKILPSVSRTLANTGNSELRYICIQSKVGSLVQFGLADAELC